MSIFQEWITVFPGKMGLSWKNGSNVLSKEEAEEQAGKHANTVAVPYDLYLNLKKMEHQMVAAQRKLVEDYGIRMDWKETDQGGEPVFVDLERKPYAPTPEDPLEDAPAWNAMYWAYNLPLQMWGSVANGWRVLNYMPRKESCKYLESSVTKEELPQFCKNAAIVYRNLAKLFEMLGRGEIETIYYPEETPSEALAAKKEQEEDDAAWNALSPEEQQRQLDEAVQKNDEVVQQMLGK